MTTRSKRSAKSSRIEALIGSDRGLLRDLVKEALHAVLEAEMTETVGAGPGERTADRQGYRAGYYTRGLVTRIGKLELRVPRDREGRFSTELCDRYQRSEKALVSALAEMYVQGVSTRKVKAITEELCGHTFSASTVSRINKSLDALLRRFAQRRLAESYPYLILDARYEKVRYLPRKADDDCRQELRWLYDRRILKEAQQDLQAWLKRWERRYPKLTDWVEAHIGETLNVYRLPRQHHKHLKSTNMLERLNEEIKRRTRVVRIFPNPDSCLRLVRALCAEIHEGWLEDHRYLNMDYLKEQKKELMQTAA